jgi:hypothetical protein
VQKLGHGNALTGGTDASPLHISARPQSFTPFRSAKVAQVE